jgi:hypothetical protein
MWPGWMPYNICLIPGSEKSEVEQHNSVTEQLSPGCSASADNNDIIDDLNCSYVVESLECLLNQLSANNLIFDNAAIFIAHIRSYPTGSLSLFLEPTDMCSDLARSVVDSLYAETQELLKEHGTCDNQSSNLLEAMRIFTSPFACLGTLF